MKYFRKYTTVKEALDYEVEHNDFVITGWPFIPAVQIQTPSGTDTSFERHHVHTKVGPSFNAGYFSDDFSTSDNYGRKIYLPDNWVLLSYIENTVAAGAFINTGYVPSMTSTDTLTTLDFDITFSINALPSSGNDGILFSICGTSCIVNSSGNLSFAGATVSTALSTNTKYTLHIHWEVSGAGSLTYNVSMSIYNVTDLTSTDKLVGTATSTYNISNDPLSLFNATSSLVGKLYYFGVYEDNDITLDMVPVVGQDNMAGMYNIRNAEFMGNSNTYTGPMYMSRTVGDYMASTGEYARVDSVHGNTLRWNQLLNKPQGGTVSGPQTYFATLVSNVITITPIVGHKYYLSVYLDRQVTSTNVFLIYFGGTTNAGAGGLRIDVSPSTPNNTVVSSVRECTAIPENKHIAYNNGSSGGGLAEGDYVIITNPMMIDLTQMYGSGNEPTLAQFAAMFPADYYPYTSEPVLINMHADSIKTTDPVLGTSTVDISSWQNLKDPSDPSKLLFPYGLCSAGSVRDEVTATQAIKRVDSSGSTYTVLSTPIVVDFPRRLDLSYPVSVSTTESVSPDNAAPSIGETTPFTAPIITTNNYGVADSR